jgi:hypothetical protein
VGRVPLLLSRYLAGLLLAAANVAYLIGSVWLIVIVKTKVVHPRFLLAGAIVLFGIAALLAFAFLVGVATSSTGVSIMATFALFFLGAILVGHEKIAAALSSEWAAQTVHALYWVVPKTAELGRAVIALVFGDEGPRRLREGLTLAPFVSTGLFGLASLSLASWLFRRKDF